MCSGEAWRVCAVFLNLRPLAGWTVTEASGRAVRRDFSLSGQRTGNSGGQTVSRLHPNRGGRSRKGFSNCPGTGTLRRCLQAQVGLPGPLEQGWGRVTWPLEAPLTTGLTLLFVFRAGGCRKKETQSSEGLRANFVHQHFTRPQKGPIQNRMQPLCLLPHRGDPARPLPICLGKMMFSGLEPLALTSFLKAARDSWLLLLSLPVGDTRKHEGEEGLRGLGLCPGLGRLGRGTMWGCTREGGGQPPARAPCQRTRSWHGTPGGTRDAVRDRKARREHACRGRPWVAGCPYWTDSRSSWPRGTQVTPSGPLVFRREWHGPPDAAWSRQPQNQAPELGVSSRAHAGDLRGTVLWDKLRGAAHARRGRPRGTVTCGAQCPQPTSAFPVSTLQGPGLGP